MKIFTSAQIHELDRYTIEHEPVKSIDLMERAANALTRAIAEEWGSNTPVVVFAGPGNNGGDALAVARLLLQEGYEVKVYLFNISNHLSEDCITNRQRLIDKHLKDFVEVTSKFDPPELTADMLVVDGLFGSGLNKPLAGGFASLVKYINQSPAQVVSIDMPSGLMAEDNSYNVRANIIHADLTLTLHQKKLSFLFGDIQQFIGRLKVIDIRLSQEFIQNTDAQYSVLEEMDVRSRLLGRGDFAIRAAWGRLSLWPAVTVWQGRQYWLPVPVCGRELGRLRFILRRRTTRLCKSVCRRRYCRWIMRRLIFQRQLIPMGLTHWVLGRVWEVWKILP